MRLRVLKTGNLSITRLHPLEADALLNILSHADATDVPEAQTRLFQKPINDEDAKETPDADETTTDWQEFVVPELRELFDSSLAAVRNDLFTLKPERQRQRLSNVTEETPKAAEPEKAEEEEDLSDLDRLTFRLTIGKQNGAAWFRSMNQARLVMAEKELWIEDSGRLHGPPLACLHYEIYTYFQQELVELGVV